MIQAATEPQDTVENLTEAKGDVHPIYPKITDLSGLRPSTALPPPETVPDLVDYDTETSGLHGDDGARVSVISLAWREPDGTIYAGAWPFGQGGHPKSEEPVADIGSREWRFLLDWLAQAGGGLSGHNIAFDLQMLVAGQTNDTYTRNLTGRFRWDTQVVAKELWPKEPTGLKPVAVRLFAEDADAEQQALGPWLGPKTKPRYDLVPWSVMKPYALNDAIYTNMLRWHQANLIDEGYLGTRHIKAQLDVTRALVRMQLAGVPYDPDASRECAQVLETKMDLLAQGFPFRPTLPAMKKWFFTDEGLNLKPYAVTEKGAPQLTAETVQIMVKDEVPHAKELQEYNRYKSAVSKWYRPFADRAGRDRRIRSQLRQVATNYDSDAGTKSGRFSAGRINLQAVPKDFKLHLPVPTPRNLITQEVRNNMPGWDLWDLDLAQAELRVAALYARCSPMLEIINEGRDPHGETAIQLFNTPPDHPDFAFNRQIAKRANFSLIFGSGAKTFRDMVAREAGVTMKLRQVEEIVYGWRDLYPEFGKAIDVEMEAVDQRGYVQLPNGRRRYYNRGEDTHSAFNQLVQSMLAEYAKEWMVDTDRALIPYRKRGVDAGIGVAGLLLVVHDSQLMLLPSTEARQVVEGIQERAITLWDRYFEGVPGGVDATRWTLPDEEEK
ncbi:DNA polymerase I [Gordonia phage Archimedes]|uniref:DNA polymerase I n=1 Tax=Gordonia phage Archimedes TaxID=2759389 RepID=A0A7L7SHP9_9CAUD|nr:DNA polymerase I [Gordonia phage Archimedes]QOC55741.1 DNA polymerase I [Gordonia phage Archimedes]